MKLDGGRVLTQEEEGVTLIELLVVSVLLSIIILVASYFSATSTSAGVENRHRMIANNLALTKIQEIKSMPPARVPVTATGSAGLPLNCDCAAVNFALLPQTATQWIQPNPTPVGDTIDNQGVAYMRQVCINYIENVAGVLTPRCAGTTASEPPSKFIRVRVSWQRGKLGSFIDVDNTVPSQ